jgi:hypothetical protein
MLRERWEYEEDVSFHHRTLWAVLNLQTEAGLKKIVGHLFQSCGCMWPECKTLFKTGNWAKSGQIFHMKKENISKSLVQCRNIKWWRKNRTWNLQEVQILNGEECGEDTAQGPEMHGLCPAPFFPACTMSKLDMAFAQGQGRQAGASPQGWSMNAITLHTQDRRVLTHPRDRDEARSSCRILDFGSQQSHLES